MRGEKPELLAPAGDFEKLQAAILYGADAVYLGGKQYSLRAKANNFDAEEIARAVQYAHARGRKVYITVNVFARGADFPDLENYLRALAETGADALIVSDPGVFTLAREAAPKMDLHISTQASTANYRSARFWSDLGAKRIVLARELSLEEVTEIHAKASELELEIFIHGAMCVAYSGRCLLSAAMMGRSANRGECAHPCRYRYALMEETRPGEYFPLEEDARGSYILNAKDLCLIGHIPAIAASGADSFKIEGRMKTVYYVAAVVKAYREALDDYFTDPALYESKKTFYLESLQKTSSRDFTTGFYFGPPGRGGQMCQEEGLKQESDFLGIVRAYDARTGWAVIEQRNKFSVGEILEFFTAKGKGFRQRVDVIFTEEGVSIPCAPHPRQRIKIKTDKPVRCFDILRRTRLLTTAMAWIIMWTTILKNLVLN
ncbi:MAG: U32 family peptidase [Clostridiales bacterium]|jgi:putative protease|nr:U32 family peptidase [Clostridiales bacterium]